MSNTDIMSNLTSFELGSLLLGLVRCSKLGDDDAVESMRHTCDALDINKDIAYHIIHDLKRELVGEIHKCAERYRNDSTNGTFGEAMPAQENN